MVLDLCQNFVSVQYLGNKWTEFHQILYMHSYLQDLRWDCYTSFFAHLYRVMVLDLLQNSVSAQYHENKWTDFDHNFILLFILTRSTLGLLTVIFRTFVLVLWPLIYAKISFQFNILRTNGQNFTKFYICI